MDAGVEGPRYSSAGEGKMNGGFCFKDQQSYDAKLECYDEEQHVVTRTSL
jgi:hypothetical protein